MNIWRLWHWLVHLLQWEPCEVIWEKSRVPDLIVLRCVTCGKEMTLVG